MGAGWGREVPHAVGSAASGSGCWVLRAGRCQLWGPGHPEEFRERSWIFLT